MKIWRGKPIKTKSLLRIRFGSGEVDGKEFVFSTIKNGGTLVEFDEDTYYVPIEEIIKEVIKFRGK